jgi:ATP-dependent DNA helicase DinG
MTTATTELMPTDDASIMGNFPFESSRDGQVEAIRYIIDAFNGGKKFVILEAPCGAGKSAIGIAIANFFDQGFYLTIQKILQDQLVGEFGEGGKFGDFMVDLKGRSNYECVYYKLKADSLRDKKVISLRQYQEYKQYHDCSDGHCRRKGAYKYDECMESQLCTYYNQVEKAQSSKLCLMNFASFLNQTTYADRFGKRSIMIIDEGHNIESQLLSFISLTLSSSDIPEAVLPELDTPEEYALWLVDNEITLLIENKIQQAKLSQNPKKADELESLNSKLKFFINMMTAEEHDHWVCEYEKNERDKTKQEAKVVFKPVYITKQANEYLFAFADHILIMSATILNVGVMAKSLGIDRTKLAAYRMNSRFPVENRPIFYRPAAKMTGGPQNQHIWGPAMVSAVNKICRENKENKGIIHTHNFSIAELLLKSCAADVSARFLFQRKFKTKQEMLEFHAKSKNSVIVAPAMHEGLDLRNDLSRFQIVCKLPFPNFFNDKQLAARKEDDEQFIQWLTALKLVQCVGRSVRSETDWANTYIIDESFKWWFENNKGMLPTWFTESIIFE